MLDLARMAPALPMTHERLAPGPGAAERKLGKPLNSIAKEIGTDRDRTHLSHSPPDPSPRWTAPPSQRASPMGPCGALPTPIRRGPLKPCGLASPPVGGVEVGGLEDGPLSLREGGGVEGGGVEGWLSPLALSI